MADLDAIRASLSLPWALPRQGLAAAPRLLRLPLARWANAQKVVWDVAGK